MKKLLYLPLIVITLVWAALVVSNYTPNTWLTGWDTLHPEMDFGLNLQRILFGVWRPEQGVGTVAIHSHMSELPRLVFLMFTSIFFPLSMVRYIFFFVTLLIGPLGVFFFIKESVKDEHRHTWKTSVGAMLGAMVYLLNLGTLQHYYVPFEMFAVQYAFLPWSFFTLLRYLRSPNKKDLFWFFVISFLASSQAYAATLAYIQLGTLFVFGFIYWIFNLKTPELKLRPFLAAFGVVLIANSYWLLPNIYSVFTQSENVNNAQINELFSQEAFLSNKNFGTFRDLALHKNFLFNWLEYDEGTNEFVQLLDEWREHTNSRSIRFFGYSIALTSVFGAAFALYRRPQISVPMMFIGGIGVFFYINENPPITEIYRFLRENIGLFEEGFRTPFTKISVLVLFVLSYFFAHFFLGVSHILKRDRISKLFAIGYSIMIVVGLIIYMLPAFEGNLISRSMRNQIPKEYLQMNEWFRTQPYGRIAKLPLHTPYGWVYYDWGYEGAGFTWFGIPQPQFDRDFDRWSTYNESFYNEARHALYNLNPDDFYKVLEKYEVKYLMVDRHTVIPGSDGVGLNYEGIDKVVTSIPDIQKLSDFGKISIYDTGISSQIISAPTQYSKVSSSNSNYNVLDNVYKLLGNYVDQKSSGSAVFPFNNLAQHTNTSIDVNGDTLTLESRFDEPLKGNNITIPDVFSLEKNVSVAVYASYVDETTLQVRTTFLAPTILVNDKEVDKEQDKSIIEDITFSAGANPSYLSVNEQVFEVSSVSDQESLVGYAYIPVKGQIDLELYAESNSQQETEFLDRLLGGSPRLCSDPQSTYPLDINGNSFRLTTRQEAICFGTYFNATDEMLLGLSFKSSSDDDLSPKVCVVKAGQDGCQVEYLPDRYELSDEETSSTMFRPLQFGDYWMDFVAQAPDGESGRSITYSDLELRLYPVIGSTTFLATGNSSQRISIDEDIASVAVQFPIVGDTREILALNRGTPGSRNCSIDNEGRVQKDVIRSVGWIEYFADNGGVSCDYYEYSNIPADGFILHLEGENRSGRSLKIYLNHRATSVNDLEKIMPTGTFNENFVVYPKNSDTEGYLLNLETRSFGRVEADNILKDVQFIPLPINWISNIRIGDVEQVNNKLKVTEFSQLNHDFYTVKTSGTGLFKLSQGYDSGWVAYSPQLGVLDHFKVNSWTNGWEVPEGEHIVYVYYWPQLLQIMGIMLLLTLFIFLLVV